MPERKLVRVKEAAEMLGVSEGYLRNADIPKVRLPGNGPKGRAVVRIDVADLDAWRARYSTARKAS